MNFNSKHNFYLKIEQSKNTQPSIKKLMQ